MICGLTLFYNLKVNRCHKECAEYFKKREELNKYNNEVVQEYTRKADKIADTIDEKRKILSYLPDKERELIREEIKILQKKYSHYVKEEQKALKQYSQMLKEVEQAKPIKWKKFIDKEGI